MRIPQEAKNEAYRVYERRLELLEQQTPSEPLEDDAFHARMFDLIGAEAIIQDSYEMGLLSKKRYMTLYTRARAITRPIHVEQVKEQEEIAGLWTDDELTLFAGTDR